MSRRTWFLLALFAIAWGLAAVASYQLFVAPANTGFDFYPRWYGARVMLTNSDPYTLNVNLDILAEMQTGTSPPDHNFFYPAYITYILLPFWLLPWPAAISLWMGLTLIALLVLPTVTFQTLNWRLPTGRLFIITLVSVFVFRQAMITYVIGQFTAWVLACLILAWVGVVKQNTSLTVLALVGSTIRPDGVIITALVLLELLTSQRWQLMARWTIVMGGLFALSVLQAGFWIPRFLEVGNTYSTCCVNHYPPSVFGTFGLLFTALIIGWFIWMLWQTRTLAPDQRLLWRLCSAILLVLLTFVQSKDYTLVYALLPIWVIIWVGKRWFDVILITFVLCLPWAVYVTGLPASTTPLILPLTILVLLTIYWQRFKTSSTYEKSTLHLS